jgi:serine/threonine protein phosphatase PrpC
MTSRNGDRRRAFTLVLLCLLLSGVTLLASASQIQALQAAPLTAHRAGRSLDSRPSQAVAYARIAVVRVLTYYDGMLNNDPAPIPVLDPCASDGVLVGTTGNNLNSFDYILTATAAVNPVKPCQGTQAAFQQLNGSASGWSIDHIDVLLNASYTGVGDQQLGSIRYTIYPALVTSNAGQSAPPLLALPLTIPSGSPSHDLPVLAPPQPSDAPADPAAATVLDLTNIYGQPLGRDSETYGEVPTDVYPISVPASQINAAPQPTATKPPTATPPQQTVTGGTVQATNTVPPAPATTPLPLSAQVSLGAPEIDSNGRLIGMVVADAHGNHVLSSLQSVVTAIGPVTSKPGPLMTQWQQGLASYYANPPQFSQASSTFQALLSAYPDFGGAEPFLTAAKQQSTTIPSLTKGQPTILGSAPPGGGIGKKTLLALIVLGLLVILLVLVALLFLMRRQRRQQARRRYVVPEDEADLDLLPPNMPLEELDNYRQMMVDEQPTVPLASMRGNNNSGNIGNMGNNRTSNNGGTVLVDEQPTFKLPVPPQQPSRARQGSALMPHPAGLTHPGIKRAADPNQDNIFALQGIRLVNGRTQPYGLFIVADGMGGHLNGQEASRLTIQIMATHILQTMNSAQPLDDAMLLSLLAESVQRASAELHDRNIREHLDMGTTLTAALVVDDMAYVINVGDSRTYIMSPDVGMRQITTDHSVVASLVSAGVIRPEDIYTHPRRNQIYRSLGGEQESVEVDTFEAPLQAGDKLLLCSDGLWEMVRDPQIEHILRGTADPQRAVELLVREANANGGEDNISAIVVRMLEDVPEHAKPGMRVVVAPQEESKPTTAQS